MCVCVCVCECTFPLIHVRVHSLLSEPATTAPQSGNPGLSAVAEEREGDGTETTSEASGHTNTDTSERETPQQVVAMDVGPSREKSADEVHSKVLHRQFILDSLSWQLQLDDLWRVLSECLDMLAQTSDPHAVLILQPTVEAFFLVHASNAEEGKAPKKSRNASSRSRLGQLSSFHDGGDPTSPAPRMDFSPIPSTPGLAKGEDSYSHLSPDTARFLMFAGTCTCTCTCICHKVYIVFLSVWTHTHNT